MANKYDKYNINSLFTKEIVTSKKQSLRIIWLHGWGHNHTIMLPLAQLFKDEAINYLIDLPGCGQSPMPHEIWGSKEYGECIAKWLEKLPKTKTIIVGHSFGCKVAMQMAVNHGELVDGLILISATGLKKKKSIFFKIKAFIAVKMACCAKILDSTKIADNLLYRSLKEKIARKLGSTDYKEAGKMRPILVKSVDENLSEIAQKISQPTLLIFGSKDTYTPPYFGKQYNSLIKNSKFIEIPELDHNSILTQGKYQVQNLITDFLDSFS